MRAETEHKHKQYFNELLEDLPGPLALGLLATLAAPMILWFIAQHCFR
jgi:hypothetical protein